MDSSTNGATVLDSARVQFEAFVRESGDRLLQAAFGMCGDWQHAEDLVQQVLVTVARRWDIVADNPAGYAYRCLTRANIDRWRRLRRHPEVLTEPSAFAASDVRQRPMSRENSENSVDSNLSVIALLQSLTTRQRSIVVLRYVLDLPQTEVAAILGISVGGVKSGASRALARLRAADPNQPPKVER